MNDKDYITLLEESVSALGKSCPAVLEESVEFDEGRVNPELYSQGFKVPVSRSIIDDETALSDELQETEFDDEIFNENFDEEDMQSLEENTLQEFDFHEVESTTLQRLLKEMDITEDEVDEDYENPVEHGFADGDIDSPDFDSL